MSQEQWELIYAMRAMQQKPWHLYHKPDVEAKWEMAERILQELIKRQSGPQYAATEFGNVEAGRIARAYEELIERQREICDQLRQIVKKKALLS